MIAPITVAIPIGPHEHNWRWLDEAIDSILIQNPQPSEILLVDDMSAYEVHHKSADVKITHWKSPWHLGVAHAFNFCVALAEQQNVIMMGSDDKLLSGCINQCMKALHKYKERDAYYWLGIKFSDGRPNQFIAVNAAMTTKGFWKMTGGFPVETAVGAPDTTMRRILWEHYRHLMIPVNNLQPLYWYRVHPEIFTFTRPKWWGVIAQTSDIIMEEWTPPSWGRYE